MAGLQIDALAAPEKLITDGLRLDGRGFEEFRSVFLQRGVISQATGSAYVELGATKAMVGVYGPRKSDRRGPGPDAGRLQVDVKLATFATRQRGTTGQSALEREYSSLAATALEGAVVAASFPKSVVDVYALVLEAGGSELGAVVTAAALALADAGVEMKDLVAACCVSRTEGALLLDPGVDEERRGDASMLLALMPSRNEVTQLLCEGEWALSAMREALELGMGACLQLDGAMRECLRQPPAGG